MERGKANYSYQSAGSNATIRSGKGTLYGVIVTPAAGGTLRIVDSVSIGASPNLNTDITGDLARIGPYVDAEPEYVPFGPGIGFNTGLTVAFTSSGRATYVYE